MKKPFHVHYVPSKELGKFYGMNFRAAKELHFCHPLLNSDKDILIDKRLGKNMRKEVILHEEVENLAMRPPMKYKRADKFATVEERFARFAPKGGK